MKKLLFAILISALALFFSTALRAQLLDAGFAGDGLYVGASGVGFDIAVQPDGKMVAVGSMYPSHTAEAKGIIVRLNADGTPDNSFGTAGEAIVGVGDSLLIFQRVAVLPNGKIVAAGYSFLNPSVDLCIVCYNSNGTPDNTFGGGDGVIVMDFNGENDFVESVKIQGDGKILVALQQGTVVGPVVDMDVLRLNADGTLDNTFGGDGKVSVDYNNEFNSATNMNLQPDGKIVIVGLTAPSSSSSDYQAMMVRLNTDGSLDNTFDSDGVFVHNYVTSPDDCIATNVLIQPDGKIIVGVFLSGVDDDYLLARYNTNFTLDNTFGTNGIAMGNVPGVDDNRLFTMELQSDGKIIVMGQDYIRETTQFTRFNTNGTLDNTFNGDGYADVDINPDVEWDYEITLDDDDNLYATGFVVDDSDYVYLYIAGFVPNLTSLGEIEFSPSGHALLYPNPLQATETLKYTLKEQEQITISLIDNQGKLVAAFVENEMQNVGEHEVILSMPNLATGSYFIQISSPKGTVSIKVVK